ncbi:hypothetical protein GF366_00625 [Candidatus Peregrinibacteria bacterium]|nr:hypothetical protein [Candidatus Peregrinibacteria bacterium]
MKVKFEVEVKKVHLVVSGAAVAVWAVLFVVFFILGWLPLRGVTAGGRPIYPWVESTLNASMYWALAGLVITSVFSGIKNLKYIVLQTIFGFLFAFTALWIDRHPYGTPALKHVAVATVTLCILSLIVSIVIRGVKVLWKKF